MFCFFFYFVFLFFFIPFSFGWPNSNCPQQQRRALLRSPSLSLSLSLLQRQHKQEHSLRERAFVIVACHHRYIFNSIYVSARKHTNTHTCTQVHAQWAIKLWQREPKTMTMNRTQNSQVNMPKIYCTYIHVVVCVCVRCFLGYDGNFYFLHMRRERQLQLATFPTFAWHARRNDPHSHPHPYPLLTRQLTWQTAWLRLGPPLSWHNSRSST